MVHRVFPSACASSLFHQTNKTTRTTKRLLKWNQTQRFLQRYNDGKLGISKQYHRWLQHSSFSTSIQNDPPFEKILIANRGEIACRVARTCQNLGIESVAIFSVADGSKALHASMADEAFKIGHGPEPAKSYLMGQEVIDIALRSGAQAIHPGYGFLSENAEFATAVQNAGLTFIGPPPSAILAMGSKSHSKSIMEKASVPTTPGYHGSNQEPDHLLREAVQNVGFPLLIKATMGGGGKGMRLVHDEADFLSALESCKRESKSAFGDDSVILERYLVNPRHVEVQIMADSHGNAVHLYERDCSLQRRHQKILEEAPASDLPPAMRRDMGEAAVQAAKAVGYVNAGTVEFLLDSTSLSQKEGNFYFCEMNTRLQVEHPITEMITGLDLVEWQLHIAAGGQLPIKHQDDIPCHGHAIEARIYAENPSRDFMPGIGTVLHHHPPAKPNDGGDNVRVDTGIRTGDDITVHYDPMICKLIVKGSTREEARKQLISSLRNYQIAGVPSNIPFLIKCAQHPTFAKAGATTTGFLDAHADDVKVKADSVTNRPLLRAIGAFGYMILLENRIGLKSLSMERLKDSNPWSHLSGSWRMSGGGGKIGRRKITLSPVIDDDDDSDNISESEGPKELECYSNANGSFEIVFPSHENAKSTSFTIDGTIDNNGTMNVLVNGNSMKFTFVANEDDDGAMVDIYLWSNNKKHLEQLDNDDDDEAFAWNMKFAHPLVVSTTSEGTNASSSAVQRVKSPMPGKITRVATQVGNFVEANQVLFVMEAMKMEHIISAQGDGIVEMVDCSEGDIVDGGRILATVRDGNNETTVTAA